ncbi:prepilin-type N-terminal cleavage/methylation domain-containing protein [Moritella sp. F3]|uniref:prepilin-type N-terminal cleavage/methylation domain-containing protein n=1 Tax=Moritella sp. F3 TaxID=2718882 RepID=UPI0018E17790|nr:prepilin-type N-terminal cleavage/methylation domain-containing protein [Moritella sp. F3]GIC75692.1 hypothetical protein FMO001_04190 [Moritella sp. F1]GIC81860.1 hypothetical protein FMO003_21410 [Moritella sp. F3]
MTSKAVRAQGFTLIELAITIIILAVLAAVAIPKFVNFREDAEISRVKAIAAAYQEAVSFVQIRYQILGLSQNMANIEGFADDNVDVNPSGFPLGIDKNVAMSQPHNIGKGQKGCQSLWEVLLINPPSVSFEDGNSDFQSYRHKGEEGYNSQCSYVLRSLGDTESYKLAAMVINYDAEKGKVTTIFRD